MCFWSFEISAPKQKTKNPVIARLPEKKKPVFRKNCSKNGFRSYGGDGEIRTLAGFNTPTAFRERTLQPLGYISICFQPVFRQKIRYSVVWKTVSIFLASARKNPPGKSRKGLHRAGFRERDGEMTVGISSQPRYDHFDTAPYHSCAGVPEDALLNAFYRRF